MNDPIVFPASRSKRLQAYGIDILPIVALVVGVVYVFFGFDDVVSDYLGARQDPDVRAAFLAY